MNGIDFKILLFVFKADIADLIRVKKPKRTLSSESIPLSGPTDQLENERKPLLCSHCF